MDRRHFHWRAAAGLAAAAGLGLSSRQAGAQPRPAGPGGFPAQPIKLIVPYPAGGIVDVVMRAVTDPLSAELPQRILVESRTGADGRIGVNAVAQAAPDGYMLLAATPIIAVGEHLFADMAGRSKDFAGVCAIAAPSSVFVCWSGLPTRTLKEFVAAAADKPDAMNVANPGSGSSIHLGQELLFERAGVRVTNVNYRGQPPSLIDMAEGRVHFGLISTPLALPLIGNGKLRALAVNAARRVRALPDVPTIAEAGFPDALVQSWYGAAVPARTPPAITAWLSEQFMRTLAQPDVRAKLEGMSADVMALGATAFDALIEAETRRWGDLIRKRGIKAG
ncbi:MAG: Bug family tripartite tricarboxylate transporter substrate binding protein [Aquabacterium sp.]